MQGKGGIWAEAVQCGSGSEEGKGSHPFIHGDADTFVPCSMCFEIYENCASKKNMLIVHGAGHVEAFYKEQVLYEQKLTEFLETAGEAWAPAGKSIYVSDVTGEGNSGESVPV